MFTFLADNKTKITGAVIVLIGFLQLTDNAAALKLLMGEDVFSVWNIIIGGLVVVLGFLNTASAEARVAAKLKQAGLARPLMLALLLAVSVPMLLVLPACSMLSQVENPTFDDKLKDVTDKATIAVQTVNAALNAHLISSEQATVFREVAANASTILHGAETLRGTDLASAQGQLDLAEALLTNLQTYLISRGAK